jgi:lantibiotic biosynthesis protein
MQDKIKRKLKEINDILSKKREKTYYDESLVVGAAGENLFLLLYGFLQDEHQIEQNTSMFIDYINRLQETEIKSTSYLGGITGIAWFLNFLQQHDVLDDSIDGFISSMDEIIIKALVKNLEHNNHDFLTGSLGGLFYFIERDSARINLLNNYSLQFTKSGIQNNDQIYWLADNSLLDEEGDRVNLGLAHGTASKIKLYTLFIEKEVNVEENKEVLKKCINFILSQKNKSDNPTTFPHFAVLEKGMENQSIYSRLAWCYGDLSTALVLFDAANMLEDETLISESINIALKTVKRKLFEHTRVRDAGLCHGTSGLALMYHLFYLKTQIEEFREASEYWIKETLDKAIHENGLAGYQAWRGSEKEGQWQNDYGILEGIAGIGLVLLTISNPEIPKWYKCLLL